ncbi:hypothetical protein QYM36_001913 [Artemia franciscana]|uniref:Endonuclease/exonuclease/phosphatase domain-containing protein n=1 Tax=Artemia franciscana TaxID=6661 RepID=A0AA88LAM8_ARTSF|nr:hypothetical protein QYM36_001913 [Artemia franciscana]
MNRQKEILHIDCNSAELKQLRKLCNQSGRKDRRKCLENITVEMEEVANLSDTSKLYPLLKESTGEMSKNLASVSHEHGNILTSRDEVIDRWKPHFQKLLNPQLSKTEQALREMKQYNIDILAVSEIRWKGVGQETLNHGYVLVYSREDSHHQAGVGLMMSPVAYRAMLKWTPINEKILFARFATAHTKLSVIVCYIPTNVADDDVKDSFYETLQAVTKDIPKHDVLCVVGDLNAKVGADRKYCPEVLEPPGLGQINENGALLVNFALSNDLVVGGTLFEHKNVHKYTWTSPDEHGHHNLATRSPLQKQGSRTSPGVQVPG